MLMTGCSSLANAFNDSLFKGQYDYGDILLPGNELPSWFTHQTMGSSICFHMPFQSEDKFEGITVGFVFAYEEKMSIMRMPPDAVIYNKTKGVVWSFSESNFLPGTSEEHLLVSYIPKSYFRHPINGGDQVEVSVVDMVERTPWELKKCGFHLKYKPDIKDNDHFQSSYVNEDIDRNELMGNMYVKRDRDVDLVQTNCDSSNEEIQMLSFSIELDQLKIKLSDNADIDRN